MKSAYQEFFVRREVPEWQSQLWGFVWIIRGHEAVKPHRMQAKVALQIVEKSLKAWSRAARKRAGDPWMDWFSVSSKDARPEFSDIWEKARFLPGEGPLPQAADAARRMRLALSNAVRSVRPVEDRGTPDAESDYEFFVSLAGHLQVIVGDRNMMLPCRKVGKVMDVSHNTISRFRQWAVGDGYIRVAKQHKFRSGGLSEATEFRFDTTRWSCLSERAAPGCIDSFISAAA